MMINFSQKHKAISAFALFLKRNVSKFRGMKFSRIKLFIEQNLDVTGGVNSPRYVLHGADDSFDVDFVLYEIEGNVTQVMISPVARKSSI
jgi:hypothetical protein